MQKEKIFDSKNLVLLDLLKLSKSEFFKWILVVTGYPVINISLGQQFPTVGKHLSQQRNILNSPKLFKWTDPNPWLFELFQPHKHIGLTHNSIWTLPSTFSFKHWPTLSSRTKKKREILSLSLPSHTHTHTHISPLSLHGQRKKRNSLSLSLSPISNTHTHLVRISKEVFFMDIWDRANWQLRDRAIWFVLYTFQIWISDFVFHTRNLNS